MARRERSRKRLRPRVAIIVETSMASGREIVKGIAQYVRENAPWSIYYEPGHFQEKVPAWLRHWHGEGIIARVRNREMAEALAATRLPVVDVLGNIPDTQIPVVQVDDQAVAQLAAEHLLERGFRHFAHCSVRGPAWAERRATRSWRGSPRPAAPATPINSPLCRPRHGSPRPHASVWPIGFSSFPSPWASWPATTRPARRCWRRVGVVA